jgi:hypothetical protein
MALRSVTGFAHRAQRRVLAHSSQKVWAAVIGWEQLAHLRAVLFESVVQLSQ